MCFFNKGEELKHEDLNKKILIIISGRIQLSHLNNSKENVKAKIFSSLQCLGLKEYLTCSSYKFDKVYCIKDTTLLLVNTGVIIRNYIIFLQLRTNFNIHLKFPSFASWL